MILLKEALRLMENLDERGQAVPFALTYCSADRERGTGGEIITLEKCVLLKNAHYKGPAARLRQEKKSAPANQFQNATRNLLNLVNGQPLKVHIHLISEVNRTPVAW